MKIDNSYDGASIDILKIDNLNNLIELSPKREKNKYSNYFNFTIINNNIEGKIYVKNIKKLMYNNNQLPNIYFKNSNDEYQILDKERIKVIENGLVIKIYKNEIIELSSYPKYTLNELNLFMNNINDKNIHYTNKIIPEINIGNSNNNAIVIIARQHPGETISSYFIEGIIKGIIDNSEIIKNNKIIIFPIVNTKGVKNGNHRYVDEIDYNRIWNISGKVKEIDYIKSIIKESKIKKFIDIHCDEISRLDYIRSNNRQYKTIAGIIALEDHSKLTRFLRALIKQRKIIKISSKTAREYISKKYKCENILVELSSREIEKEKRIKQGYNFIKEITKK